ncbi:unnamed protein product [Clavelina lepadiformis]|uniref:H15 domain-containing protein n=1 Tax=Clavelina lepadiformis TaxID=159417 RepID=A0ABP0GEF7_CLALP
MSGSTSQVPSSAKKTAKKASAPSAHPTYQEMISKAIATGKERGGSSRQAIIKYIKANYKVGDNAEKQVRLQLPKLVLKGVLSRPKGKGASGSFKLVPVEKKKKPKVVKKKPAVTKPKVSKKTTASSAAKKPAAKKAAAKPKKAVKKSPVKKAAAKKTTAGKKSTTTKKSPAKKAVQAKKTATKKTAKKPAAKKAGKAGKNIDRSCPDVVKEEKVLEREEQSGTGKCFVTTSRASPSQQSDVWHVVEVSSVFLV